MNREPRKIVITGAAGLLGSHLMAYLSRKHSVVGVDRHVWWGEEAMPFVVGDLADEGFVQAVMEADRADPLQEDSRRRPDRSTWDSSATGCG